MSNCVDIDLDKSLIEQIYELQQEITKLKGVIETYEILIKANNINNWNELKKWLEELDKTFCETTTRDNSEFYHFQRGELMFLRNIKLKMQELENRKV